MNLTAEINADRKRIDKLLKELRNLDPLDSTTLFSSLSEYICIRIAGYLEVGVDSLLNAFVERQTKDQRLRNVAAAHINGFRSANYQSICKLLSAFDEDWAKQFKKTFSNPDNIDIPTDIDALFTQRNTIAHGGQVYLDRTTLTRYFSSASKLLKEIARLLN